MLYEVLVCVCGSPSSATQLHPSKKAKKSPGEASRLACLVGTKHGLLAFLATSLELLPGSLREAAALRLGGHRPLLAAYCVPPQIIIRLVLRLLARLVVVRVGEPIAVANADGRQVRGIISKWRAARYRSGTPLCRHWRERHGGCYQERGGEARAYGHPVANHAITREITTSLLGILSVCRRTTVSCSRSCS